MRSRRKSNLCHYPVSEGGSSSAGTAEASPTAQAVPLVPVSHGRLGGCAALVARSGPVQARTGALTCQLGKSRFRLSQQESQTMGEAVMETGDAREGLADIQARQAQVLEVAA